MKYKALVADIDGTITHQNRRLNLKAAEMLYRLNDESGIPVVLATGNILCFSHAASKLIGLSGYVIAENGGVVSEGFDTNPYIMGDIKECRKAFSFLSEYIPLTKLDPEYRKTEIALRRNFDLEYAKNVIKSGKYNVDLIDTGYAVHIKSNTMNKGTGLVKIAELMGLNPKEFVAIGDSENDLEMIEFAGIGIAVANSDQKTRSIADIVTDASYGEGVVEAIERLYSCDWNDTCL
ncbi:SPP-like hydrolase [Methanohalobium evestigatum Z-7303]|uniref:Phosphoglycolate phosphatase n=1 Tax=Methanohalobium evestigatum (strain ATCC BAA-1072 / DSM 3721 / NBRC 107634 / OCM 161 / Z-7303) TaxID=644295 RepID=D7EAK6_METEZ|nr:phosphoglycolate phosphatase [Methanohalobium evestigatum]ADI75005.1 SPP-like hydrolase [Methanohalobium evestigatum Z-7303]